MKRKAYPMDASNDESASVAPYLSQLVKLI